ncbi:MFS transporter [Helicobacter himalayensis]|uniref:MFS transporter n=1 Tax=Helicobacter himalayensis TaxID=1591088 RepID=UPI003D6E1096
MNKKTYFWLSFAIMVAITLNLRAPINSMGPSIEAIKEYFNISSSVAGLLNSIPLLAFGSISFVVAYFSGVRLLFIALCCIALGEIMRSFGGIGGLFVGMGLLGAGIAVANVLVPSFIRKKFGKKTSAMMSVYSLVLNISSIIGILLALPLIALFGIKIAMAFWAIFALFAIVLFLPEVKNHRFSRTRAKPTTTKSLFVDFNAWKITLFIGLQGFVAYSTFTWLPVIIASKGYSLEYGTNILLYMQLISMPVAFLGPLLLGRLREIYRSVYMAFLCGLYAIGYVVMLFFDSQSAMIVGVLCLGIPMGGVFGLALLFISQKSATLAIATKLSSMSQGFGYLIAASGPFLIGVLHDLSESYVPGIVLVLCAAFALNIFGILTNKCKVIGS